MSVLKLTGFSSISRHIGKEQVAKVNINTMVVANVLHK